MAEKKLLKKLDYIFNLSKRKKSKEIKYLKKLLSKLKEREANLEINFPYERNDKKRKKIKQEIKIIHAQRKKGSALLDKLKK